MTWSIRWALLLGLGMTACTPDRDRKTEEAEAVTAPVEKRAPDPARFVISQGNAGFVHIGMPVAALQEQLPGQQQLSDTTLHLEGQAYNAYLLHPEDRNKGLLIEQQCDTTCEVWRIRVIGKQYKTAEGVGVGSAFGEVQQYYPIKHVSLSEAGLVAVAEQAHLSFVLNTAQLPQEQLGQLAASDIPANTPVQQIIIY